MSFHNISQFLANEKRVRIFREAEGKTRQGLADEFNGLVQDMAPRVTDMKDMGLISEYTEDQVIEYTDTGTQILEGYDELIEELESDGVPQKPFYDLLPVASHRHVLYEKQGFDAPSTALQTKKNAATVTPDSILYWDGKEVVLGYAAHHLGNFRETVEDALSKQEDQTTILESVNDQGIEEYVGRMLSKNQKFSKIVSENEKNFVIHGGGVVPKNNGLTEGDYVVIQKTEGTYATLPVYKVVCQPSTKQDLEDYLETI